MKKGVKNCVCNGNRVVVVSAVIVVLVSVCNSAYADFLMDQIGSIVIDLAPIFFIGVAIVSAFAGIWVLWHVLSMTEDKPKKMKVKYNFSYVENSRSAGKGNKRRWRRQYY